MPPPHFAAHLATPPCRSTSPPSFASPSSSPPHLAAPSCRPTSPTRFASQSSPPHLAEPSRPSHFASLLVLPSYCQERPARVRFVKFLRCCVARGSGCTLRRAAESFVANAHDRSRLEQASSRRQTYLRRLPARNTPSTDLAQTFEEVSVFSNFLNLFLNFSIIIFFQFSSFFLKKWS